MTHLRWVCIALAAASVVACSSSGSSTQPAPTTSLTSGPVVLGKWAGSGGASAAAIQLPTGLVSIRFTGLCVGPTAAIEVSDRALSLTDTPPGACSDAPMSELAAGPLRVGDYTLAVPCDDKQEANPCVLAFTVI